MGSNCPAPDFIMVLDGNYARFLRLGIKTLNHFHPDSRVFLYDVSPSPSIELQEIAGGYPGVDYRYWPEEKWLRNAWIETLNFSYFFPGIANCFKYISRLFRHRVFGTMKEGWVVDKDEFLRKIRRSVSIWMQKAPCCAESLERSDRDIILLDADAFVWNPLDSVFLKDFDVGLTMRRLDDIRIGIDGGVRCAEPVPYHAINAGAMFFRNNDRSLDFVRLWIEKMSVTRYFLVEQTALALLVLEADESAFTAYERGIRIETDRAPIAVRLLPCEKYNNFYIGDDLSFTPDSVYVAHFKGYLHRQAYFSSLSNLVEQRLSSMT